jgi:hypothetical protein
MANLPVPFGLICDFGHIKRGGFVFAPLGAAGAGAGLNV